MSAEKKKIYHNKKEEKKEKHLFAIIMNQICLKELGLAQDGEFKLGVNVYLSVCKRLHMRMFVEEKAFVR